MTLKLAIECVERKQMCNKKDIRDCYGKECDKCNTQLAMMLLLWRLMLF